MGKLDYDYTPTPPPAGHILQDGKLIRLPERFQQQALSQASKHRNAAMRSSNVGNSICALRSALRNTFPLLAA